jgi:hypothetical protein
MSKKTSNERSFQEKFKNRMENMGKEGVNGIMKNTEDPINKTEINKVDDWNNLYNNCNKKYDLFR